MEAFVAAGFVAAGPCGTKQVRTLFVFNVFGFVFKCFLNPFLRLPGGAGASAHLEKQLLAWRVLHFSHVRRLRAGANK